MWKLYPVSLLIRNHGYHFKTIVKYSQGKAFLSEVYRCQEAWDKRLITPILQSVKLDDLYYELEQKFQSDGKASALDIDMFANAVQDDSYMDELEDLIHKLRLSANTGHMLPSTPHAVIRIMLTHGRHEQLLRILNDRLNYGIFPDDYCLNLLMDTFLKNKNFADAAKVSVLQMLQEDWHHPLTTYLALYSCHMYLKNPADWQPPAPEPPDDGEEVKVRVGFLRNPYFDDHFDLVEPLALVGKTLHSVGMTMPNAMGRTYQLLGLALYNKWDRAIGLIQQFLSLQDKPLVYSQGIKMIENISEECTQEENQRALKSKMLSSLKSLDACDDDLEQAVEELARGSAGEQEGLMVERQCKLYKEWEQQREQHLQEQLEALRTQQRLQQIKQHKEELVKKEEELFFFDNEDKWDLVIDSKKVFYKKRYFGKKKTKRVQDEHYIPPEIRKSAG